MGTSEDQDHIDRRVNDFAAGSFRDTADRDYIVARMACRAGLMQQFLWGSQQAFEKYLKYILLVNRIPAKKVRHDIKKALSLTEQASFKVELTAPSLRFIDHVAQIGEYRYLDVSYFVEGYALVDLDRAVWDLRRYCQILDVFGKRLPENEQTMLDDALAQLQVSKSRPPYQFRLANGFLETVLKNKKHSARGHLIWNNAFFGDRKRKSVKAQGYFEGVNSPLYLFPQMLDEVVKYVFIPRELQDAYRTHLATILADPSTAP